MTLPGKSFQRKQAPSTRSLSPCHTSGHSPRKTRHFKIFLSKIIFPPPSRYEPQSDAQLERKHQIYFQLLQLSFPFLLASGPFSQNSTLRKLFPFCLSFLSFPQIVPVPLSSLSLLPPSLCPTPPLSSLIALFSEAAGPNSEEQICLPLDLLPPLATRNSHQGTGQGFCIYGVLKL